MFKASIGDLISFKRNDWEIQGVVDCVKDKSVTVNISQEASMKLGYETNKTVVKHSNYQILIKHASA